MLFWSNLDKKSVNMWVFYMGGISRGGSRQSSQPRDGMHISCTAGDFFTVLATSGVPH